MKKQQRGRERARNHIFAQSVNLVFPKAVCSQREGEERMKQDEDDKK